MSNHPIESLLRPPVERWPAMVAGCAAAATAMAPGAFMMPPTVGYSAAGAFALFSVKRFRDAQRVVRYQKNLRRVPDYTLSTEQIPWSARKLFLGRGFQWTQIHTQRLRDAMHPDAREYQQPSAAYQWARRKEVEWERTPVLSHVATALHRNAWWNPLAPLPPVGGLAALHGVEPDEQDVWANLSERGGHTLVLGTTGVGKTREAELLIAQDIRRGDVVIVLDPKGDGELLKRVYLEALRAGRADEFSLFHLGFPEHSTRYNPIGSFSRITEVAGRITGPLPDTGNSAAFKEFAWRFSNSVARALVVLGRKPDLQSIIRHVSNIEPLFVEYSEHWLDQSGPKDWRAQVQRIEGSVPGNKDLLYAHKGRGFRGIAVAQYLQVSGVYDPVADSLRGAFTYDRTGYDKLVASLLPLLEKLTSGQTKDLLVPDYTNLNDTRPVLDWMEVIRRRGIVYVGLDALADKDVAEAVGNAMFADLISVASQIYKHGTTGGLPEIESGVPAKICLHADEFNEIIGDEFIPMLNKARGAGFQVTAYTQTISDIEARLGSRAKAGQTVGNFNTLIMLRVKEHFTAEILTKQLREVEISTLVGVSGTSDSSTIGDGVDFTSRNEDRIATVSAPMLTPADVMALPKGQAFALIDGNQLWKIRFPLPNTAGDPPLPAKMEMMCATMAQRYQSGNDSWQSGNSPARITPISATPWLGGAGASVANDDFNDADDEPDSYPRASDDERGRWTDFGVEEHYDDHANQVDSAEAGL